jgi:integrase
MARRIMGPRWYASRKSYFVTIKGVTHNLGSDQVIANRRYAELTLRAPTVNGDATVSELIAAFLTAKTPEWKPKTLKTWRWPLNRFAKSYGGTRAADLIPYTVTSFRQAQTGWGNNTARIFISAIKYCFKWAVEQGLLADSPLKHLRRPDPRLRDDSCLVTAEQHRLLLAAAPEAVQDVLEALWHTGQRPGAVLTVEGSEVQGDVWILGDKPGRKLKRITVYLNEPAQALTARLMAKHPTGPLFRNQQGNPWIDGTFQGAFREARLAAGCPHVTPYSYRHAFGRRALDAGVDISDLAVLMNTSVAWIEKTYGHRGTLAKRLRAALKMVG